MSNDKGCTKCGATKSEPFINEKKHKIYWFAASAGTKDFGILFSSLKRRFAGSTTKTKPKNTKAYDFFCSSCFKKIMKAQLSFIKKPKKCIK